MNKSRSPVSKGKSVWPTKIPTKLFQKLQNFSPQMMSTYAHLNTTGQIYLKMIRPKLGLQFQLKNESRQFFPTLRTWLHIDPYLLWSTLPRSINASAQLSSATIDFLVCCIRYGLKFPSLLCGCQRSGVIPLKASDGINCEDESRSDVSLKTLTKRKPKGVFLNLSTHLNTSVPEKE